MSFALLLTHKLQHSFSQEDAGLLLLSALDWPAGKSADGFLSHKQAWTVGMAACLTGALVGAVLMLWAETYAAKVQRSLNTNIEQYQALQSGNQVYW